MTISRLLHTLAAAALVCSAASTALAADGEGHVSQYNLPSSGGQQVQNPGAINWTGIICGDDARTTQDAVKSLNEIFAKAHTEGGALKVGYSRVVPVVVSAPVFNTAGSKVTACVSIQGRQFWK